MEFARHARFRWWLLAAMGVIVGMEHRASAVAAVLWTAGFMVSFTLLGIIAGYCQYRAQHRSAVRKFHEDD